MMEGTWDLEGMIEDVIKQCDFSLNGNGEYKNTMTLGEVKDVRSIARKITNAENGVQLNIEKINTHNYKFQFLVLQAQEVQEKVLLPMKL
jgi:hypothetical protein